MKNRGLVKKILLLTFLLVFTGVSLDFTSVKLYAAEENKMEPVYGSDLADGTYDITVDSSSSMFRIVKARLTVNDGEMSAVITLGGTGYLRLFMGTGEEALKASAEEYAEYEEDADGAYTYTVAVEALDKELECTGFSRRREKWYDHQIVFESASLEKDAFLMSSDDGNDVLSAGQERISLSDGEYMMNVTLGGGSGKASVTSPAKLTVTDGMAVAELEWSSQNYDYMLVNGEKYFPVNTEGNSVFEIPVMCFDKEMPVIADTVAMSASHEIEYTLIFEQESARACNSENAAGGIDMNLFFLILIAVLSAATVGAYVWKKNV